MTDQEFSAAVLDYFMTHRKECTPVELAEFMGVPVSRVRTCIKKACGVPDGSNYVDGERPVYERNYGTVRCHRVVAAYLPSRNTLADKIKELTNAN